MTTKTQLGAAVGRRMLNEVPEATVYFWVIRRRWARRRRISSTITSGSDWRAQPWSGVHPSRRHRHRGGSVDRGL